MAQWKTKKDKKMKRKTGRHEDVHVPVGLMSYCYGYRHGHHYIYALGYACDARHVCCVVA